jgi:hypothetical protein
MALFLGCPMQGAVCQIHIDGFTNFIEFVAIFEACPQQFGKVQFVQQFLSDVEALLQALLFAFAMSQPFEQSFLLSDQTILDNYLIGSIDEQIGERFDFNFGGDGIHIQLSL